MIVNGLKLLNPSRGAIVVADRGVALAASIIDRNPERRQVVLLRVGQTRRSARLALHSFEGHRARLGQRLQPQDLILVPIDRGLRVCLQLLHRALQPGAHRPLVLHKALCRLTQQVVAVLAGQAGEELAAVT